MKNDYKQDEKNFNGLKQHHSSPTRIESSDTIKDLLFEVIENGFKSDLCLSKRDKWNDLYSILKVVNKKMDSIIHKRCYQTCLTRHEILSLVLYTGCECNYDLCASQKNGNYKKWKWFDLCLRNAIQELSNREQLVGISLFAAKPNVTQDKIHTLGCSFPTYVSTSWNKQVSLHFMKKNGTLIEINDDKFINNVRCSSVDWVSKFPDECEVLIARSDETNATKFDLKVIGQQIHSCEYREDISYQLVQLTMSNNQDEQK